MGEILTIIAMDVHGSARGLGAASLRLLALACPLHRRWLFQPQKLLQITIQIFPGLALRTRAASAFSSSGENSKSTSLFQFTDWGS